MSNGDVSQGRRRFLIGATSVVGGVGVVGAAVPFVASWNPSAKAEAAGAPVTVNVSKLEPGQQMTVEWRGKPVWIIRRTETMNENILELNDRVKDPLSKEAISLPISMVSFVQSRMSMRLSLGSVLTLAVRPSSGLKLLPPIWAKTGLVDSIARATVRSTTSQAEYSLISRHRPILRCLPIALTTRIP